MWLTAPFISIYMFQFDPYTRTFPEIQEEIELLVSRTSSQDIDRQWLIKLLSFVDLTTLEGSDNDQKIISMCHKAKSLQALGPDIPGVAAVCFYPPFIRLAKKELAGTGIHVASVAGAFPSGQSPLSAKIEEIKYAVDEGVDEIDTVINRGKLLAGEFAYVSDELSIIRESCGEVHLKVILETGELQSVENIRKASEIAILAGADFIKTSTGKIQPAATPEAFFVMAETIREYAQKAGKKIGIKPAGGISTASQAYRYLLVLQSVLGSEWVDNTLFRIGASRLTDDLVARIGK